MLSPLLPSAEATAVQLSADLRLVADFGLPMTDEDSVWQQAAIDINTRSGRIVAAGPEADLGDPPPVRQVVGGLVMPGFVNAHAHTAMSLLRSVGDGAELSVWLSDHVWPLEARMSPADVRVAMLVGIAEMHLGGITTSCEMYAHEREVIYAASLAHHRLVMVPAIFSAMLEDGSPTRRLDEIDTVRSEFAGQSDCDLVTVGYGPHSLYVLPPDAVAEVAERARQYKVPLAIHLEETQQERQLIFEHNQRYAVDLLASVGALCDELSAAHGVWLSGPEQLALAEAGAAVVHCPSSNLKLGSGVAPVAAMASAGLRVALGTDGPASNDRLDLWEEMRLAALLARGTTRRAGAITAGQALGWATRQGAEALGRPDMGWLGAGAVADIMRVELNSPAYVGVTAENLMAHVVFAGSRQDVTDVWIAGRQVVAQGVHTTLDLEAVNDAARVAATRH